MGVGLPFNPYRALVAIFIVIFLIVGFFSHGSDVPIYKLRSIKFAPSSYSWSNHTLQYPIARENMTSPPRGKPLDLPPIQHLFFNPPEAEEAQSLEQKRTEIKNAFHHSWASYEKYAWGKDELKPLSLKGHDSVGGWGASIIDSLDTLWLMNMEAEFYGALRYAVQLDWNKTTSSNFNVFETNVRHLGGLLAAFELSQEQALLDKATELGDLLYATFDNPEHMPPSEIRFEDLQQGKGRPGSGQSSSSLIGMSLEFTRLSQLTGDAKYYDAINRIAGSFNKTQDSTRIPGLWPNQINAHGGFGVDGDTFSYGTEGHAVYENLLKEYILLQGQEPSYKKMFTKALDATMKKLLFRPMLPDKDDILMLGQAEAVSSKTTTVHKHLEQVSCFAGGMVAMSGKLFGHDEHVVLGDKMTRGCVHAYSAFPHGVPPEMSFLQACPDLDPCEFREKTSLTKPQGFKTGDGRFLLRPETIESVFILYRITGNNEYRDIAWTMWESIKSATRTDKAYASIEDVTKQDIKHVDSMESVWFSETLKYFYLIFSDEQLLSLDDWVFNTGGHAMKKSGSS